MPATHVVPVTTDTQVWTVNKNGKQIPAQILQKRPHEVYVHYVDTDKRLDEWVPEGSCQLQELSDQQGPPTKKRRGRPPRKPTPEPSAAKNAEAPSLPASETVVEENGVAGAHVILSEEEFDMRQHKQLTAQKNFDTVMFDVWKITPWYFSPYPLTETETAEGEDLTASSSNQSLTKIPGVVRATPRSHGRTSDLLAGGLQRHNAGESLLWVCHFCFKYMAEGGPWELHKKDCKMKHPPGKKVYQRGAHIIWEVDGAKEKLYCQNLSLFGKLFIDVKTLFFDCDNFLFYILTDAKSSEDHILGFFSKEKLSYDDYNLACIMTLPQYQRKGYGMLLIEFSYELSRRAGKIGSPERPLSDLGLRSYLAYWTSTLIRFFRRVLSVLPPDIVSVKVENNFPDVKDEVSGHVERVTAKRRRTPNPTKGFEGVVSEKSIEAQLCMMPMKSIQEPIFTSERIFETIPREDGGAETHVQVRCKLADIARATNLRADDAAFALNECGMLMRRLSDVTEKDAVVITRSLVEKVAKERNVKIMYLDLSCVLLP